MEYDNMLDDPNNHCQDCGSRMERTKDPGILQCPICGEWMGVITIVSTPTPSPNILVGLFRRLFR